MEYKDLSMRQKSELFKIMVQHGYRDIDSIERAYNEFKDGGFLSGLRDKVKTIYNKHVRPVITNTSDQRGAASRDEAYYNARREGAKTFVWNGGHYNTDYSGEHHKQYEQDKKSGKVDAWEEKYPGYTYPLLVKAKQEELDTYGITNEQTRNKKRWEKNYPYTTGFNYFAPVEEFTNAVLNKRNNPDAQIIQREKDQSRFVKEHVQNTEYLMGVPIPDSNLKISSYKPSECSNKQDYYYAFTDRDPSNEFMLETQQQNQERNRNLRQQVSSLPGKRRSLMDPMTFLDNNIQKHPTTDPSPLTEQHKIDSQKRINELTKRLNKKSLSNKMKQRIADNIVREQGIIDVYDNKEGNHVIPYDYSMGQYTVGITPDYRSYYDLWDFKYNVGRPFELYNRSYNKKAPDIDSLFKNFTY